MNPISRIAWITLAGAILSVALSASLLTLSIERNLSIGGVVLAYGLLCAVCLRPPSRGRVKHPENLDSEAILIAFASQSGMAEEVANRTATTLRAAAIPLHIVSFAQLDHELLSKARTAVFIASTTGEGDAPDSAAGFIRKVMGADVQLRNLRYGLLALGDSEYKNYCAFGHMLDRWLRTKGAMPLFDVVEVDDGDASALRHWQAQLGAFTGHAAVADWSVPTYGRWILRERRLLNSGSQGGPVFHLTLEAADGVYHWQAGDIAEVGAGPLASSPAHREYSIASLPSDGRLELLVRQMRSPDGCLGIGSGWLTEKVPLGGEVALRIRENRNFHEPDVKRPLILIGNGTGLAGLRAHLKKRAEHGAKENWLIFGERSSAHDFFHKEEIENWQSSGVLKRIDLAFSRDQASKIYVQHRVSAAEDELRAWIARGAAIYVCGSLEGMAAGVAGTLHDILGRETMNIMQDEGRYRRDVY